MHRVLGLLPLVLVACTKRAPSVKPGTLPPSGYYDVRYEITSWSCASERPSPFTVKRMPVETTRDGASGTMLHANVWGDEMPGGRLNPTAQTDLPLRRGEKRTKKEKTVWNCGAAMQDTFETEITDVSHDRLRLKVTRTYGDMSICDQPRARAESGCRAETSVTFTLVEGKCELPSTGREQLTPSGATEMVCYQAP